MYVILEPEEIIASILIYIDIVSRLKLVKYGWWKGVIGNLGIIGWLNLKVRKIKLRKKNLWCRLIGEAMDIERVGDLVEGWDGGPSLVVKDGKLTQEMWPFFMTAFLPTTQYVGEICLGSSHCPLHLPQLWLL